MGRKGNPYDNGAAESLNKTIKYEEVYLDEYESFEEAEQKLKEFIEVTYNTLRLHSSLGYLTPAEFERAYYSNNRS
jgi:putative transposase